MKIRRDTRHTIDFIFPLAVLFVFAVSAFAVLVLSAHVYASQTAASETAYASQTPLSYVREKIRQNDAAESISVGELDGVNCLVLTAGGTDEDAQIGYTTYIYAYEGMLKELTIRDGVDAEASAGRDILAVSDFTVEETADGLFCISCENSDGEETSMVLSERSFH